MKIIYTEHAKYRMLTRKITENMVERTLFEPEKIGIGYNARSLAWKRFEKGTIKVVYIKNGENYIVITVMWE